MSKLTKLNMLGTSKSKSKIRRDVWRSRDGERKTLPNLEEIFGEREPDKHSVLAHLRVLKTSKQLCEELSRKAGP